MPRVSDAGHFLWHYLQIVFAGYAHKVCFEVTSPAVYGNGNEDETSEKISETKARKMSAGFQRNATIPTMAFATVALGIALSFLGTLVISRLELMQPGIQYLCADDGPTFCYTDGDQFRALLRAPFAFFVTFVLVPPLLAGLMLHLQKALPCRFQGWACAVMWLVFVCYLAVPMSQIYLSSSVSNPVTETQWTLYPPLSEVSSGAQSGATLKALQINKAVVAVLLSAILISFIANSFRQPRSTVSGILRLGFATVLASAIWMTVSHLSLFIRMITLDRNFGTVYFKPNAQPDEYSPHLIFDLFQSPELWPAAWIASAVLCCLSLWFVVRQT